MSRLQGLLAVILIAFVAHYAKQQMDGRIAEDVDYLSGRPACNQPQQEIKNAFMHSWNAYKKYAWGHDVYHPLTKTGETFTSKPLGWIIVDSLDTMMLMGLDDEIAEARKYIETIDYNIPNPISVFETTIRMIGGLLSAHYMSGGDKLYLDKAVALADRILPAFDTPSGVPTELISLAYGIHQDTMQYSQSSTAEVGTLQLEFKYLSNLTGNPIYWEKAEKVMKVIEQNGKQGGLVPIFISPITGKFTTAEIRMGSRGDSYYEYLIKQYLQTNKTEDVYRNMYDETVDGVREFMLSYSMPSHLWYIGELPHGINNEFSPKMDHLVCFAGGMYALGATNGKTVAEAMASGEWTERQSQDLRLGKEITKACVETYFQTETGLGPEIVVFNSYPESESDFYIKPRDTHNLQRPETVESLMILYRLTGDEIYREWGYKIFQSFEKHTKLKGDAGYACIRDVTTPGGEIIDNMESFWLAETLKYLWLLFDDTNQLPLDQIVFNTEAHPLPVFNPASGDWERQFKYDNSGDLKGLKERLSAN